MNKIIPEVHLIDDVPSKILNVVRDDTYAVILPNVPIPFESLFRDIEHTDGDKIELEAENVDTLEAKIKWNGDKTYKVIYNVDSKTNKTVITKSNSLIIKYNIQTEIVYVWVAYQDNGKYIFDKRNAYAIYIQNVNTKNISQLYIHKQNLSETMSLSYSDVTNADINLDYEYYGNGVLKLKWRNFKDNLRSYVTYNIDGDDFNKEIQQWTNEGQQQAYLKIELGKTYVCYIANWNNTAYENGYLFQFKITANTKDHRQIKKAEHSKVFSSEIFERDTVLAEISQLFNEFAAEYEREVYHRTDTVNFIKELKSYDNLFTVKQIEMVKPTNAFKGTVKDLQYISRLLDEFSLQLYKAREIDPRVRKLLEYGEFYSRTVTTGSCVDTTINNQNPLTILNSGPWTIDNNPQPCEETKIDRLNCMYDAIARINLTNTKLTTVDSTVIADKVSQLFRERMWTCLQLRFIAIIFDISEYYNFPVNEDVLLDMFAGYEDIFPTEEITESTDFEANFEHNDTFFRNCDNSDLIINDEGWIINNVKPETINNKNPLIIFNSYENFPIDEDGFSGWYVDNATPKTLDHGTVCEHMEATTVPELTSEYHQDTETQFGTDVYTETLEYVWDDLLIDNGNPWTISNTENEAVRIGNNNIEESFTWTTTN